MNPQIIETAGHKCSLYVRGDVPQCLLLQALGEHARETLTDQVEFIAARTPMPFAVAAFHVADWECDLMPWHDPLVFSGRTEGTGNAADTLRYLLQDLLPCLQERLGALPLILGGYSLAGLFSLWAARECNAFRGVAAASPSVWISDWPDYAESHPMLARQVYLSLGKKEEHAGNRAIKQVGERIRSEYALLQRRVDPGQCILEWNRGGHFTDCERRLARAFLWNLECLSGKRVC